MAEPGDFFVGYLRPPLRLVRFLAIAVIALFLLVDAAALVAYRSQEARASGEWGDGEVAYDGTLLARPYPIVIVAATREKPAHAVLLVEEGKFGAPADLATLDGHAVTAQGYPLLRDGVTVLQLSQHPRALDKAAEPIAARDLGTQTLTGEIADSKCFLGAMIPGEGKVHESCAGLCLLGGIPALFVTRDAAGKVTYRVLADADGGAMADAAAANAGMFLTLTGKLRRLDGIDIFSVPRAALE